MTEYEIDNRDPHTTWLRIQNPSDLKDGAYIEIDPFEVFHNMLENNYSEEQLREEGIDLSDLEDMMDTLKNILYTATS